MMKGAYIKRAHFRHTMTIFTLGYYLRLKKAMPRPRQLPVHS